MTSRGPTDGTLPHHYYNKSTNACTLYVRPKCDIIVSSDRQITHHHCEVLKISLWYTCVSVINMYIATLIHIRHEQFMSFPTGTTKFR